jgi:glycosyltransferase involved in cell wall biosynthesis
VREEVTGEMAAADEGLAAVRPEITDDDARAFAQGAQGRAESPDALTILMPVKDPHPEFLADALTSVVEQSSPRWRLLIVVEPSDLDRFDVELARWTTDARVQVIANDGVRLAGAINTGMRQAETEFVALLLGDDLWYPDAVAVLEEHIARHPDVDFFHSGRRIIHDGRISDVYPAKKNVTLDDFLVGAPVKHLLCWRRSKGLAVGGLDERSRSVGPDDFDFPWTMAEQGATFHAVDACLYGYRDHRDGVRLTTHLPRTVHIKELRRVYRKHGLNPRQTRERINRARGAYLRQCLYQSKLDERLRRWLRRPPRVWYDTYR